MRYKLLFMLMLSQANTFNFNLLEATCMRKILAVTAFSALSLLCASASFAANKAAPAGHFKTGLMSSEQAKQLKSSKKLGATANQLFVCNQTNLPAQAGTTIQVSFPQTGVTDQLPAVNQCAYLSTDSGTFTTQVVVYAPANSGNLINNSYMSGGQMWGVSYNGTNNTFTVFQMQ
jgi:hypothetical protein